MCLAGLQKNKSRFHFTIKRVSLFGMNQENYTPGGLQNIRSQVWMA